MYLKIKPQHNTYYIKGRSKAAKIKTDGEPTKPEAISGNHIRKAEQHYSEQQIPSSQQPAHVMKAETCRDNKEKTTE
jgi:hypothetical protein